MVEYSTVGSVVGVRVTYSCSQECCGVLKVLPEDIQNQIQFPVCDLSFFSGPTHQNMSAFAV